MLLRYGWHAGVVVAAASLTGCSSSPAAPSSIPARSCSIVVWHRAASDAAHVELVGDWDGWARPGRSMDRTEYDGWRAASVAVAPGEHLYAVVEDGAWLPDPDVATTGWYGEHEVTWRNVPDCGRPGLAVDDARGAADGTATLAATFTAASARDPLDPATLALTERDGTRVDPASIRADPDRGAIALTFAGLAPGKHVLRVDAKDTHGRDADPAWATIWIEAAPRDPRDTVIYQVIVDRYRDGQGNALAPPASPAGRAGGHVDGVRAALESGELAALGVNTLWISPLYANPADDWPGLDGRTYSSYHGYWPIASRALDPRVATEASLDALVASAHARGIRVLFDVVPNHVHQEHPYVAAHAADGWFDDPGGTCVCGVGACDWARHVTDCWFASYLPDLAWTKADVADQITSDVAWWLDRFDGDGVRIDAVPMMPRSAVRRVAGAIRAKYDHPAGSAFLLGENYVGPGGYAQLRYDLGPGGLDSEFHFPLMWALRGAIADENEPMGAIDAALAAGESAWAGSSAVMTTMIGNHDVVRFATESAGDGGGDGWTLAAQAPDGSDVYAKQTMALGAVFTLPGAPVVYYGDELALAGHADPDSRRVFPAESALTAGMRATRAATRALGRARACSPALRRGAYRLLFADAEHLAYARELDGADPAVVLFFRRSDTFEAPLPGVADGEWVDVLSGRKASLRSELTISAGAPLSVQLLFPQGSPCAAAIGP